MTKKEHVFQTKRNFNQLLLLIWKNYRLQIRSIIGLLVELLVPAMFAIILLPIRTIVKADFKANSTEYEAFGFDKVIRFKNETTIAYQPDDSPLLDRIMLRVGDKLNFTARGFRNETALLDFATRNKSCLCAVQFTSQDFKSFTYRIRFSYSTKNTTRVKPDKNWQTNALEPSVPILGPREQNSNEGGDPGYYREGFIQLQKQIDFALIQEFNPNIYDVKLELKRFPYPPYNNDNFVVVLIALFPFIIILSFIFTVIFTAKSILQEKESGLKEAMKLMGMKPWVYWLSWYLKTFAVLLPSLLFMSIAYCIKLTVKGGGVVGIVDKSNPFLFGLFLFTYASSTITFTFLCTTFFKKANQGAAGTGVIFFLTYLPFLFISLRYQALDFGTKILTCFINNLAMCNGLYLLGSFEGKGSGIQFSNWTKGESIDDSFSFFDTIIIMFFNNFLHIGLLYYFENVMPGNHGIAKPWYFPLSFCLPKRFSTVESDIKLKNFSPKNSVEIETDKENNIFIEDEAIYKNKNVGIRINNLTKKFKQLGKLKTAVDNLSLNIYEEQISVLLGHNGAGKSTTISMITGLTSPTRGNILIDGIDVIEKTQEARKNIGYCPQHNLLFDDLTVYEHLKFFSKLKENFNDKEIDDMLDLLNLRDKKFVLSKSLSGGMKRKLSVGIAFIGNSKIVILDEPSSGMDPQARHSTWTLLQKFKKERKCTILLTTHFMDEADFLGDRIAIMSKGSLKCCGSPLYLKSKYGNGYNLVINKKKTSTNNTNEDNSLDFSLKSNHSTNKINDLVKGIIPSAKLNSDINAEISFILPSEEANKFSNLFEELEQNKDDLEIVNIGVSVTTIEDVFLRIGDYENAEIDEIDANKMSFTNKLFANDEGENINKEENGNVQRNKSDTNETKKEIDDFGLWTGSKPGIETVLGASLLLQQFLILIKKRFIHSIRNKSLVISQILIPIGVLIINLIYIKVGPIKPKDLPAFDISLSKYDINFSPFILSGQNDVDKQFLNNLSSSYVKTFEGFSRSTPFNLESTSYYELCSGTDSKKDIESYLKCVGKNNYYYFVDENLVAATMNSNQNKISLIGHFNNQKFHLPPLIVNLLTNSLFKLFSNSTENNINAINYPLPRNQDELLADVTTKDASSYNIASTLTFGFSFLMASFVIFIIKERTSNSKHLQYMSGANPIIFWLSALVWDLFNYMIPLIFTMVLLKLFDIDEFVGGDRWIYILLILLFYGFAHIPQMYLLSYLFKASATGFAACVGINILLSQATIVSVNILNLPGLNTEDISTALEWIFMPFIPSYTLGQGVVDLYQNSLYLTTCKKLEFACPLSLPNPFTDPQPNPCCGIVNKNSTFPPCGPDTECLKFTENFLAWEKPGASRMIFFMILQFIIQITIVLLIETGLLTQFKYLIFDSKSNQQPLVEQQIQLEEQYGDIKKDEDVVNEETRIFHKKLNEEEIFVVDRLTKHYSRFMAVKGISFSLDSSECFGLLGVNGAGKTSTFKMITGDELITSGEAFFNFKQQIGLKSNIKQFQKKLGYCPQFDPIIDQMTVYETMELFANLRGIRKNLIKRTCTSLIELLDLKDHVKKMCYTLSGGNKRKLSVAIALVGSPLVILLDEPTSGMDPKTRRTLWNCLNEIRSKGKSLILTTHSMDETEALCSKIGIMVNGELKCLGSLQHLKSRYGDGYTLIAKVSLGNGDNDEKINQSNQHKKINEFIEFVLSKFSDGKSKLKESRDGFINIHINENSTTALSKIFSLIESVKVKFSIEFYVVTQTKLEQIFLNFASKQIDPETRIIKSKGLLC